MIFLDTNVLMDAVQARRTFEDRMLRTIAGWHPRPCHDEVRDAEPPFAELPDETARRVQRLVTSRLWPELGELLDVDGAVYVSTAAVDAYLRQYLTEQADRG